MLNSLKRLNAVAPALAVSGGLFVLACGAGSSHSGFGPGAGPTGDDGGGSQTSLGFGDGGGPSEAGSCATAEAVAAKPPVDFIFTVAQCGSMTFAVAGVQANLNGLASLLTASGLDYRVVLMAAKDGVNALCVPTPLASAGCESNPPNFRLVDQHLESTDTTALLMSTYNTPTPTTQWNDFLRPNALKIFVMTTDENADDLPAVEFDAQLTALPGNPFGTQAKRNYIVYPIIGANAYPDTTICPGASQTGAEYQKLALMTGGKWYPVCNADYSKVFADLSATVNAQLACQLTIPTVPGQTIDPNQVNVNVTAPDGTVTPVVQDSSAACDSGANGWQYSADGKSILLCGAACDAVKANTNSKVSVQFGCQTKVR
jgi:hypothetical protein